MIYLGIWFYLILQRLLELRHAKSNEKYQKAQGAIEIQDPYYKLIVWVHTLFFLALLIEAYNHHQLQATLSVIWFICFILLQLLRFWLLQTMGRFWNTKVIVLPGAKLVNKGLFCVVKHPNYWIVFFEFIVISLLFHAYWSAIIFPILHIGLMSKRIPMENRALEKYNEGRGGW
ncbi:MULTISPECIES: isoprenylcysteine carboxyl methyltransferase family protein [Allobacillus]|uniref:Isoprenylcysteine carboxyl methyltransferase n=1 Tax=Allobacillus salarius TaxID=1955272 RepID=A0A556PT17_9BACI|nr:isoprenylcysteine carboxylmethyltransferase family protein [Allobacillus salarius]TSJ67526.1 hypothetical protein FPQ13_00195 [Allobacillus salarius]